MKEDMKSNIEMTSVQEALQNLFPDTRAQVAALIKTLDLEMVCAARK